MENGKDTGTDAELRNGGLERDSSGSGPMVFEEDLRRAAGSRALDQKAQTVWMELRRSLPISRWAERTTGELGHRETGRISRELNRFREIFENEAKEHGLELDMSVNYYSQALNMLMDCRKRKSFTAGDRSAIRELMILVDWKDSVLGMQILQSLV
jgi:hypothetical protein